ncbi:AAA family ATPase [Paenibacillus gansuensis]|uniref:AAA family ATPase n=1 Tax=Paenibacillus gansuensis TaxID=306542 RepID=A0ABW5PHU8_9BACL
MDKKIPLFIVTGASGVGKTTVIKNLRGLLPEVDIFEIDAIHEFVGDDWNRIQNIWLRVARNIAESGRISIICGTMMPWDAEKCEDYQYFKNVYFLNLHCDDETRELRLRARNWSENMIHEHKSFANWLLENADKAYTPPMPTVDTSKTEVYEVALKIREWVRGHIIN